MKYRVFVLSAVVMLAGMAASAQEPQARFWKPVPDEPFLQEINGKIPTDTAITQLALLGDTLYAVLGGSLHRLDDSTFAPVADAPAGIAVLESMQGALWIAAADGVYRFDGSAFARLGDAGVVDFTEHRGAVHAATRNSIFRYENGALVDAKPASGYLSNDTTVIMEDGSQVLTDPIDIGPSTASRRTTTRCICSAPVASRCWMAPCS